MELPEKKRKPGRPRKSQKVTDEIDGLITPKLLELIKATRVAVYRGGLTPHTGKYEKRSKRYTNQIMILTELDLDADGNITEAELKLNVNVNNKLLFRLPQMIPGDILAGFKTCDDVFLDSPKNTIYPGKMVILPGRPRLLAKRQKMADKKPSASKQLPLSKAMEKVARNMKVGKI